jgi:hypothetical protein
MSSDVAKLVGSMEAISLPRVSAAMSCLFLLLLPFRLWQLQGQSVKVIPGHQGVPKLVRTDSLFTLLY